MKKTLKNHCTHIFPLFLSLRFHDSGITCIWNLIENMFLEIKKPFFFFFFSCFLSIFFDNKMQK